MAARSDTIKLNKLLKTLGMESVTINNEGDPITRFEQLAAYIWKAALGWTEKVGETEIIHKPDKTYVCMIYDRMEGKIPVAAMEKGGKKASVADRVSDQTLSRINGLSE